MDDQEVKPTLYRRAIAGRSSEVDVGNIALWWLMVVVIGAIPLMVLGAYIAMFKSPTHAFAIQELGVGIGAVCGGFGVALAAVKAFRG